MPYQEVIIIPPEPNVPVVHDQQDVRGYVRDMCAWAGQDTFKCLFIIQHESQFGFRGATFDPAIRGPEKIGASWGLAQFYDQNKGFNKACATDIQCSIRQMTQWLKDGRENEWSSWRFRYEWYKDECQKEEKNCG